MDKRYFTATRITVLAVLLALVVVLQIFCATIPIGTVNFTLTLVPIVLGAILVGPLGGAILGLVLGVVVVLTDPYAMTLMASHPFLTVAVCIIKSTAAGLGSGLIYRALYNKNKYVAAVVASAAAPVINTGLFILGMLTMLDVVSGHAAASNASVFYYLFIICAGVNFLIELGLNLVLSPAIYRVCEIVTKRKF